MKFSEQWLREWVNPPVSTEALSEQLTMAGLEVEGIEDCQRALSQVVVAKVNKITRHPDSEKLSICEVDAGEAKLKTVVCGAPNVKEGYYYPLAKVGSVLADGKEVCETEILGILSEGMLCSEAELGLSENTDGLMNIGKDGDAGFGLAEYLKLDDRVIEIALTPNRGDCLSIAGIAREIGVVNEIKPLVPEIQTQVVASELSRKIKLAAPKACPIYVGRVIEGIDISRPLPVWITEKLRRSGIRSINPVVDVTNYVMLELGQPMHAFDNDLLNGNISVRYSRAEESVVLLDGQACELTENTLLIADDSGAIAMAGIMGGLDTSVTDKTCNIFLESAYFSPEVIMGKARQYGMHTDSSHRFERGVDYQLQVPAIERATQLILQQCGGKAGPVTVSSIPDHLPKHLPVTLRKAKLSGLLGINIDNKRVTDILRRLDLEVVEGDEEWQVTAASFRSDINIEVDLIEEIARIYGYDNIPNTGLEAFRSIHPLERGFELNQLRKVLHSRGYNEAITYSFVDKDLQSKILGDSGAIALMNPISADLGVMRRSLWPGLLTALQYNTKRQQQRVRLYEYGRVFEQRDTISQEPVFAGLIYGNKYDKQWNIDEISCNFYDMKGDLEALLKEIQHGIIPEYVETRHPALHPGQSADIVYNNQVIGQIGAIHPVILKSLDISQEVFVFEIKMSAFSVKSGVKFVKYSKYPSVKRDIAIVLDNKIPVSEVINCINLTASDLLENLELFDLYQGEGIDIEKKSLALGLTFQGTSSTLTDREVDDQVDDILSSLQKQFSAILRE